ncbi:TPA: exopolysaccharide biosynthesis polyprenyl glycosylphosphotransferase [Candidatus Gracilibacteria bacterium]|nr:exopolysaccharide biosynthesis polyprenyl glycosylphosphotransferase [Candidatus Gracilibacteria bacterium]HIQ57253.1 exopolysaccharide biosynthesis polyprenyl glycosylphosphotransferase [Candidatus Gracilibacteria bacterium]
MHRREFFRGVTRIITDFISVIFAWKLSYFIRPITDLIPNIAYYFPAANLPHLSFFQDFILISAMGFIFILFSLFLYSYNTETSASKYFSGKIIGAYIWGIILWGMSIVAVYALVFHELIFSRVMLAQAMIFTGIIGLSSRYVLHILFNKYFVIKKNIAIISSEKTIVSLSAVFENNPHYNIIFSGDSVHFLDFLEKTENKITDIFFTDGKDRETFKYREYIKIVSAEKGFRLHIIPHHSQEFLGHSYFNVVEGIPVTTMTHVRQNYWFFALKRFFDVLISSVLLILFIPLFLFISLKLQQNIIYSSQRVGKNGVLFTIYKFRSMVLNADIIKDTLLEKNQREGPLFKIKNDPRITKFGNFLRKTSIDELPQLWNVIKGDMSLIGPRPHLQKEVEQYSVSQRRILSIKPGISGLAQVSGRSDLSFEREIFLDSYYCENMNIWLDLKIFLKTPIVLLFGKGSD